MKKIALSGLVSAVLATASFALDMTGNIWLEPNYGMINGTTITLSYDREGFYDTTQMYNEGFRNSDGKFAMKIFNYGSGWGGITISPAPTSYTVVKVEGNSLTEFDGWLIWSDDASYSIIEAEWDVTPPSLSYTCDDYCLASRPSDPIGIVEPDSDGVGD